MTGVFGLGDHFRATDGYKVGWEYIHGSIEFQNDAILKQGRVSKSNFNIAQASRILILEMVCNGLQRAGGVGFDLTSI